MKGLAIVVGPPKKASSSSKDDEGAEGEGSADSYKKLIADAAKDSDWEAMADAIAGLCRMSDEEAAEGED